MQEYPIPNLSCQFFSWYGSYAFNGCTFFSPHPCKLPLSLGQMATSPAPASPYHSDSEHKSRISRLRHGWFQTNRTAIPICCKSRNIVVGRCRAKKEGKWTKFWAGEGLMYRRYCCVAQEKIKGQASHLYARNVILFHRVWWCPSQVLSVHKRGSLRAEYTLSLITHYAGSSLW